MGLDVIAMSKCYTSCFTLTVMFFCLYILTWASMEGLPLHTLTGIVLGGSKDVLGTRYQRSWIIFFLATCN